MNKAELINAAAEKAGLSKKDTESAVNAAIEAIVECLANDDKEQAGKTRSGANGPETPKAAKDGLRSRRGLAAVAEGAQRDSPKRAAPGSRHTVSRGDEKAVGPEAKVFFAERGTVCRCGGRAA